MEWHVRNVLAVLLLMRCLSAEGVLAKLSPKDVESDIRDDFVQEVDWQCNSDSDCPVPDSKCTQNQCQCSGGYIYNSNMTICLKVATAYGDSCIENIQCSAYLLSGAICKDNLCSCGKGYYYMHGMCRPYSALHEKCTHDCYVPVDFEASSCKKGFCECSPGFYQREYRTCRREGKKIGDPCEINVDCTFDKNATCKSGVCDLNTAENPPPRLFFENKKVPAMNLEMAEAKIGDNCKLDADCKSLGHALCGPLGTCVCNRAHFPSSSGKCVPEIGESCQEKDDPPIKYSRCSNGRWACSTGFVVSEDNRVCRKVTKKFGMSCRFDEQCHPFGPDAICAQKKCACNDKSRYIPEEMFCWTKRSFGESCNTNVDCFVEGSEDIVCKNNVCSCPDGKRLNSQGTRCVSSSAGIGMACDFKENCNAKNSDCKNGKCACIENYYESLGDCIPGINATCTTDGDCGPRNSMCKSNKCTCGKDFVASSTRSCLPVVQYYGECTLDIQCVLPNAVCVAPKYTSIDPTEKLVRICVCKEGYHYNYGKCFKKKLLGEKCTSLGECYLDSAIGMAVCKNGQCACNENYIMLNETACTATTATAMLLPGSGVFQVASPGITAVLLIVAVVLPRFD